MEWKTNKGQYIIYTPVHGPVYFGLKALGAYMEPLFHNNDQIYEELLSLHMNLHQEVLMYN